MSGEPRYQLEAMLSSHRGRVVYRARDVSSGDLYVAVARTRHADQPPTPGHEFEALCDVAHPAIVPLHDRIRRESIAGRLEGAVPGTTVEVLVFGWHDPVPLETPYRPMAPRRLAAAARSLLGALAHLHARGWLHLGLRPGVLIRSPDFAHNGRMRLLGLPDAQRRAAVERGSTSSAWSAYSAPEVLDPARSAIGPWTDIYSAAVVLRTLATGLDPRDPSPWPEQVNPAVVAWFERALSADPTRRPASAFLALDALLAALGQPSTMSGWSPARVRPEPWPRPRSLPARAVRRRSVLPFVGRTHQWRALEATLRDVVSTRRPQVTWVDGAQGSGATRLVWEFTARAEELQGVQVLRIPAAGRLPTPSEVIDALAAATGVGIGAFGQVWPRLSAWWLARARLDIAQARLVASIIAERAGSEDGAVDDGLPQLAPQPVLLESDAHRLGGLRMWLRLFAGTAPLVVVCDGVASDTGAVWIRDALASPVWDGLGLWIIVAREDDRTRPAPQFGAQIRCGAMEPRHIEEVVRAVAPLDAGAVEQVVQIAAGLPGRAIDLAVLAASDRSMLDQLGPGTVPRTWSRLVERLAAQGDPRRIDHALAAAAMSTPFVRRESWQQVCAQLAVDAEPIEEALLGLRVADAVVGGLRFRSERLVTWLKSRVPDTDRAAIAQIWAGVLLAGGHTSEEQLAAVRMLRRNGMAEHGLVRASELARSARDNEQLASAELAMEEVHRCFAALNADRASAWGPRVAVLAAHVAVGSHSGTRPLADLVAHALAQADVAVDQPELAGQARYTASVAAAMAGQLDAASRFCDDAITLAESAADRSTACMAMAMRVWILASSGRADSAVHEAYRILRQSSALPARAMFRTRVHLGDALAHAGQFDQAYAVLEPLMRECREQGRVVSLGHAAAIFASTLARQGRHREAIEPLRVALDCAQTTGSSNIAFVQVELLDALIRTGQYAEAREMETGVLDSVLRTGRRVAWLHALTLTVARAAAEDDAEFDWAGRVDEILSTAPPVGMLSYPVAEAMVLAAGHAVACGRVAVADDLLRRATAIASRAQSPVRSARVRDAVGLVSRQMATPVGGVAVLV